MMEKPHLFHHSDFGHLAHTRENDIPVSGIEYGF
jgi:hypothetical protein